MLTEIQRQDALVILPFLADPTTPVAREFIRHATRARFPAGMTVFTEGDVCSALTIVLSGAVRVFQIGETGREITLYRFAEGESCILTANCILSQQEFPAIAVVERQVDAFVIPHDVFSDWMNQFQPWRTYVFHLLAQRLATVMAVIDEVAFRRMDVRIAEFLLRQSSPEQPIIGLTHQQIASELGTSREVVSRILADFADSGLLQSARGSVTIVDRNAMSRRAEAH